VGIYDRDYYRHERAGFSLGGPRTAILTLILANVAVYLLDGLFCASTHRLDAILSARVGTLTHPYLWWQFITCGFVHDPNSFNHILFNMLGLWFLGRDVEELYGRAEFVRLYLVLLLVGSVAWAVIGKLRGLPDTVDLTVFGADPTLLGASGAVTGVVLLYALNFPRRMILFMFVLPMPAWVMGVLLVLMNVLGGTGVAGDGNVAYSVHLAGAALAFLYFRQHWNFGRLLEGRFSWLRFRRRPRLRVHEPPPQPPRRKQSEIREEEVDRILEKIHREGESSLTRKERHFMETASREYQKRRRSEGPVNE
jgi:membrane associated rhomboid family serine protease